MNESLLRHINQRHIQHFALERGKLLGSSDLVRSIEEFVTNEGQTLPDSIAWDAFFHYAGVGVGRSDRSDATADAARRVAAAATTLRSDDSLLRGDVGVRGAEERVAGTLRHGNAATTGDVGCLLEGGDQWSADTGGGEVEVGPQEDNERSADRADGFQQGIRRS